VEPIAPATSSPSVNEWPPRFELKSKSGELLARTVNRIVARARVDTGRRAQVYVIGAGVSQLS